MRIYTIVGLIGKAGSGKDAILQKLFDKEKELFDFELNRIIRTTTRAKRELEINGIDYNFVNFQDFYNKVANGDIIEATSYNNTFYGTELSALSSEKINIGIFDLKSLESFRECENIKFYPVLIKASNKNRLIRQLTREDIPDCDEIVRRYKADEKDFNEIDDILEDGYRIVNNDLPLPYAVIDLANYIKELA